jgi:exopolysaccharide biosynthesis protein
MLNRLALAALACAAGVLCSCRKASVEQPWPEVLAGVGLTNHVVPEKSWEVFAVRIPRSSDFEIHSTHANGAAVGLTTLTEQLRTLSANAGKPVAAVNGDFYQRDRAYAGDPRGLQIVEGKLISAPSGTSSFWVDAAGAPHIGRVESQFNITWPNGATTSFGLNEDRTNASAAVLFTPAIGASTKTANGAEIVLERDGDSAWLPLRIGEMITARVREVRSSGDTSVSSNTLVLSLGADLAKTVPTISNGAALKISTTTSPDLRGARTALSGGPLLVRGGKALKIDPTGLFDPKSYSARSMTEEHPRSAIGWNEKYFFLVEVDGRRKTAVGMTLEQLAAYMVKLGCTEAMNLDGGGSATLWCNGAVVNKPADGKERPIANALVVTRRTNTTAR